MNISGIMIYYYFICQRKLWYFLNEINMEQNSELVSIGKIIDETTYSREKKGILIDNTINVDFIRNGAVLHEIKKTKSIEEAGIWQIKYYMYYLEKRGVKSVQAQIDYPLIRKTKKIYLDDNDREILENIEKNIKDIKRQEKPPHVINKKMCKNCAYYDLCYV
jgi:CRISPR-associated exonuclease Cas4